MKRIVLCFCFLLICFISFCQNSPVDYILNDDGSVSFTKIIESKDRKTKEELFQLLASNYYDSKTQTQSVDKEHYYIIKNGTFTNFTTLKYKIVYLNFSTDYIMRIDCKDGRIRVVISVFKYILSDVDSSVNAFDLIKNTYPFVPAKKEGKMNATEKLYSEAFSALQNTVNQVFININNIVNINTEVENSNW